MKRALLLILCLCLLLPAGALAAETCQPGDSGAAVTQLQRRLIELGLLSGKAVFTVSKPPPPSRKPNGC